MRLTHAEDRLDAMKQLLAMPDLPCLTGRRRIVGKRPKRYRRREVETIGTTVCHRGNRITYLGAPDRRSKVFLPLLTRWAQGHYMRRGGEL